MIKKVLAVKKCAVIGSVNMDMVTRVDRFPQPGETRTGRSFATVPGGKGANQAVALGHLGVPVRMLGSVGDDLFGHRYLEHFRDNGVDPGGVSVSPDASTGVAAIEVSDAGENHIVVVPGANGACGPDWLDRTLPSALDADIFLLQLEIPLETVLVALGRLKAAGKVVVLDPAPATALPREALQGLDFITPNETELRAITAELPETAGMEARMRRLLELGVQTVVHKAGPEGAYIGRVGMPIRHVPGFQVRAVDTTAAGDTFNAGLCAGLALGYDVEAAVRLANAAGAISVTAPGAQGGMPTMRQVEDFLQTHSDSATTLEEDKI